jgi:signal transduction histidine kinase
MFAADINYFDIWWNRIFTFALVAFWLGLLGYSLWQRYRIRKRSESLEVEAELGRSSAQLFHDISGHIGTLAGYMYMVEQDAKEGKLNSEEFEKLKEFSKFILDYTRNFKHLVGSIYEDKDKSIDLIEILKLIIETQAKTCFRKLGIEIVEHFNTDDARVSAHAMEAFFNIIRNACEAMADSDEKQLSIGTEVENDSIRITITDTGPGIPENVLTKIFTYGFTTKDSGSGQGMTIAKQAVERCGGRIRMESVPGKGTTAIITLPIAET